MSIKRALISGVTGQDGSYLAEFLLARGYEVHGIVRRIALEDPAHRMVRIAHIADHRPAEVDQLRGEASKAREILGWSPRTGFEELVTEMVKADWERD